MLQESDVPKPEDPFSHYGLKEIEITDKSLFDSYLNPLPVKIAEYTFANLFIWKNSIRIRWGTINNHLCVFANGDSGLTMPLPPLGEGSKKETIARCLDICIEYNKNVGYAVCPRIEYLIESMLPEYSRFDLKPIGTDYVYLIENMIKLEGRNYASKRQSKNRFLRRYKSSVEDYDPSRHFEACNALLGVWYGQSGETQERSSVAIKRCKEALATAEALRWSKELGLSGMVLFADEKLIGFTLGETLATDMCSILIEKTDREYVGSAQYIFSEFCARYWANVRYCNVGDDWDVPSLKWTKESYHPCFTIHKWAAYAGKESVDASVNVMDTLQEVRDGRL